ncbi:hypothetical protein RFI_04209 [Reticulomyxa filosa]|uniref:Uncharacterized protein n=1 Tax=Reticulomyxa filosa TaxID=46433 RepID=X6P5N2_RETFI|nr:hypothetical protein RFI_04209 [Reticulomyxa filosa]|eukprot:ETO32907.1 hypothetical protein RFI_04209 [Reticulomyxa filosa]
MCAEVCAIGSVEVDAWTDYALKFQRWLQMNDSMLYYEFPGTHNSHISVAYGFGIERDYVSALHDGGELYWGGGDLNLGEGVDQYLSVTDQLNIGIRHIEVDINWGPWVTDTFEEGIVICHSPVTDPDIPVQIKAWADQREITDLQYEPSRLSCQATYVTFLDSMNEASVFCFEMITLKISKKKNIYICICIYIKKWLDTNVNDFVIVYFDTKWDILPEQAEWGTNQLISIFGDAIFTPEDQKQLFNGTWPSLSDLIYTHGKRLLFENQKEGWTKVNGTYVVFTPTIWNPYQYGADGLEVFPKCLIQYNFTYGVSFTRALDDTVEDSSGIQRQYRSIIDTATRCGSNIVRFNYVKYVVVWKAIYCILSAPTFFFFIKKKDKDRLKML